MTTARTQGFRTARTLSNYSKTLSPSYSVQKYQKDLEKKGFTNVLIRDHSEFSLSKWTKK